MSPEHGCPSLLFLTRSHVSPQNLRTLLTLSLECLKFRCLSLGPWGHEKQPVTDQLSILGVNLPRLLVLWQHWQSKPQRINFVLALLRLGINFLWSGFLCWPPKHVFCWVPVVLDHFFLLKKLGYLDLRWSKPLGALSQLRPVENWWTGGGIQSSHGARGGRTQMYEILVQEMYVHRSLGWAPLSNSGKLPGITVKNDETCRMGITQEKLLLGRLIAVLSQGGRCRWGCWGGGRVVSETLLHLKHLAKHTKGVI